MLSAANMFLLGVVDTRPINPYEIVSRFEYNRFNSILSIAESTIYVNIRTMNHKGYIQYELQKDGMMPAKKVYHLTDIGREELKNSVRVYLSSKSTDLTAFSVALLLMHYFPKEELLKLLNQHKESLRLDLLEREDDYRFVSSVHEEVPCIPNVACSGLCYLQKKAEMDTVCSAIAMLERAEVWPQNTFAFDQEYLEHYRDWVKNKNNV